MMDPKTSRLLLTIGAAAGMLTFLGTFGGTVWSIVEFFRTITPPPGANGGLASVSMGVDALPLLLGLAGLVAFVLCLRSLRKSRPSR